MPALRRGSEHYHHDGEEWIYLLSGALTLSLAGNTYDLMPGDAAHFDSRLPHRLIAMGNQDAEVLLVASPVTSSTQRRLPVVSQHRAVPATGFLNFFPSSLGVARAEKLKIRETKPAKLTEDNLGARR